MNAKLNLLVLGCALTLLPLSACSTENTQQHVPLKLPKGSKVSHMPTPAPDWELENYLSPDERADGFILLFDGKTSIGWRGFNQSSFPLNWRIDEGTLHMVGVDNMSEAQKADRADIVYSREFSNFILKLEWKISPKGDSGIFYLGKEIQDAQQFDYIWKTAPEMQILDNQGHPDANKGNNGKRLAGSLYDLIPANPQNAKPVGQWNQVEIHVKDRLVKHILNGEEVVKYQMDTPVWNALIQSSKFPMYNPNWANVPVSGLIGLQDHDDPVWFRNIKLKPL